VAKEAMDMGGWRRWRGRVCDVLRAGACGKSTLCVCVCACVQGGSRGRGAMQQALVILVLVDRDE